MEKKSIEIVEPHLSYGSKFGVGKVGIPIGGDTQVSPYKNSVGPGCPQPGDTG